LPPSAGSENGLSPLFELDAPDATTRIADRLSPVVHFFVNDDGATQERMGIAALQVGARHEHAELPFAVRAHVYIPQIADVMLGCGR
jgi:hypothetical protein